MNTLDLNRITIVPAGSASHIPYLVYLARGRDIEQPSVIVLLDSDSAGKQAEKELRKGGPKGKQLIKPEYVLVASTLQSEAKLPADKKIVESEDFVPPGIASLAVQRYLQSVCGVTEQNSLKVTATALIEAWTGEKTLFDAIVDVVVREFQGEFHVDKVGLARSIVEVVQLHDATGKYEITPSDLDAFRQNFGALLAKLAQMQRKAERDSTQERISRRIDRSIKSYLRDHVSGSRREDAMILLEEVEAVLDDSMEADQVKLAIQKLRREHDLTEPKPGMVEEFVKFSIALQAVRYSAVNAVQEETTEPKALPKPHHSGASDQQPEEKTAGAVPE